MCVAKQKLIILMDRLFNSGREIKKGTVVTAPQYTVDDWKYIILGSALLYPADEL